MFQNLKIVDTYFVRGIQNLRQLTILNLVYIDIDKSPNIERTRNISSVVQVG